MAEPKPQIIAEPTGKCPQCEEDLSIDENSVVLSFKRIMLNMNCATCSLDFLAVYGFSHGIEKVDWSDEKWTSNPIAREAVRACKTFKRFDVVGTCIKLDEFAINDDKTIPINDLIDFHVVAGGKKPNKICIGMNFSDIIIKHTSWADSKRSVNRLIPSIRLNKKSQRIGDKDRPIEEKDLISIVGGAPGGFEKALILWKNKKLSNVALFVINENQKEDTTT